MPHINQRGFTFSVCPPRCLCLCHLPSLPSEESSFCNLETKHIYKSTLPHRNIQIIETQFMEDRNALLQFSKPFIPVNMLDFWSEWTSYDFCSFFQGWKKYKPSKCFVKTILQNYYSSFNYNLFLLIHLPLFPFSYYPAHSLVPLHPQETSFPSKALSVSGFYDNL